MNTKANQVFDLIDDLCSDPSEKFEIAKIVFHRIAKSQDIHEDKLVPGGLAEQVVCKHFNLDWNKKKKNGVDARMKDGRSVEIKSSNCKKSNIMYDIAPHKSETKQEKCDRILAKFREVACHIWFIQNKKQNEYDYIMILPGEHVALLIYEIVRLSTISKKKINFGGVVCNTCNLIHRHVFITKVFGVPKIVKSKTLNSINWAVPPENINWTEVARYFNGAAKIKSNGVDCKEYLNELVQSCIKE